MSRRSGLLAAIVSAALVSACLGATEPSPAPSVVPATPGGDGAATAEPVEPVTLVVWDFADSPEDKAAKERVNQMFMDQHPGVTVKLEPFPGEWVEKMRAAVSARRGPDVMFMFGGAWPAGMQQGFIPLQDRLTEEQKAKIQYIDAFVSPDGNLYALPFTSYAYLFLFNRTLFEQAGLDPDDPPATWDELLEACAALKAAGLPPIGTGWKDADGGGAFFTTGATQSLGDRERDAWVALEQRLDVPPFETGLNALVELNEKGCFQPGAEARLYYTETKDEFDAGKTPMILWPIGNGGALKQTEEALGEGVADAFIPPPFPGAVHDTAADGGPNAGYGVTSWTPHPDLAWEYVSFITSAPIQQFFWDEVGYFPNHLDVTPTGGTPLLDHVFEALKDPDNFPLFLGLPQPVGQPFRDKLLAMLAGDAAPQQVLAEMQAALEDYRALWQP
jgi:multiple sugar transport system substrate-binding protein